MPVALQQRRQHGADAGLVVDEEDAERRHAGRGVRVNARAVCTVPDVDRPFWDGERLWHDVLYRRAVLSPTAMPARSVLVADDEKNIRLTLTSLLDDLGYDVDIAANGFDALIKARTRGDAGPYWRILLDLRMPCLDGMEALYEIQRDAPGSHLVLLTAQGTIDTAVDAMRHGADDFLTKPFTPSDIRRVLARLETRDAEASEA